MPVENTFSFARGEHGGERALQIPDNSRREETQSVVQVLRRIHRCRSASLMVKQSFIHLKGPPPPVAVHAFPWPLISVEEHYWSYPKVEGSLATWKEGQREAAVLFPWNDCDPRWRLSQNMWKESPSNPSLRRTRPSPPLFLAPHHLLFWTTIVPAETSSSLLSFRGLSWEVWLGYVHSKEHLKLYSGHTLIRTWKEMMHWVSLSFNPSSVIDRYSKRKLKRVQNKRTERAAQIEIAHHFVTSSYLQRKKNRIWSDSEWDFGLLR